MHQKNPLCKGAAVGLPAMDVEAVIKTAAAIQGKWAGKIDPKGGLCPEGIRSMLKLEGIKLKVLAELNGFADPWFHQVINRQYPDPRVRRILADALDMPYECVWGKVSNAG